MTAILGLRRAGSYGCVAVFLVALTFGQEPAPPARPPTFRGGIDVVQLDVSALDRNRKPVRGLSAQDFTVLEDGVAREIVAFTPVELQPVSTPANAAAAWPRDVAPDVITNNVPREGRLVIIAFDWSIRFQDTTLARKIAIETVNSLGPNDEAAVIFTSEFSNAGVPQNFTADRARLLAAINQTMAVALKGNDVIAPSAGGFINANGELIEDPQGYAAGGCMCRVCSMEAMTRVADAVRPVTGRRKVMIFIGSYFRGFEPAMVGPRGMARGMPPPPMAGTSMGLPAVLGPGSCSLPLKLAREKLERSAGLSNLTVHVVDPVGIETSFNSPLGGATTDTMLTRQDSLHMPADLTGGRAVISSNAPESFVPAIMAESQSYYLIGFQTGDRAANDRLRRIQVKVARPGVTVRTRAGYYGNEEAAASTPAPASTLLGAVDGTMPRAGIPLTLVAMPFATPGRTTGTVGLVAGIQKPARTDTNTPAAPAPTHLRIVAAALDPKGRMIASREETLTAMLTEGATFEWLSRLELAPGPYQIRVGINDESGHSGSVFGYVDVPAFSKDRLTLSGVSIIVSPAALGVPADRLADLTPGTPTGLRTFARTDTATAALRLYQADSPADVTLLTRIVDATGRVVFEETQPVGFRVEDSAARVADYQVALPLARLAPGEYLLAIQASAKDRERRRNVRFSVR